VLQQKLRKIVQNQITGASPPCFGPCFVALYVLPCSQIYAKNHTGVLRGSYSEAQVESAAGAAAAAAAAPLLAKLEAMEARLAKTDRSQAAGDGSQNFKCVCLWHRHVSCEKTGRLQKAGCLARLLEVWVSAPLMAMGPEAIEARQQAMEARQQAIGANLAEVCACAVCHVQQHVGQLMWMWASNTHQRQRKGGHPGGGAQLGALFFRTC
jgi:hypothetical protein